MSFGHSLVSFLTFTTDCQDVSVSRFAVGDNQKQLLLSFERKWTDLQQGNSIAAFIVITSTQGMKEVPSKLFPKHLL